MLTPCCRVAPPAARLSPEVMLMSYRSTGPRFNDFHDLTARRDSVGCVNGDEHRIQAGESIGWSRKWRLACCAPCWSRWCAENAEADRIECRTGWGGF
jgi:hypothetical protein